MQLKLTATGLDSEKRLYQVTVNDQGNWEYESRAVERLDGTLTGGELAQLKSLYDKVTWDQEVVNNPVSPTDHVVLHLEVDHGNGRTVTYRFSDVMTRLSFQFRDLVHFLRHNLATGGDPVGAGIINSEPESPRPTVH